MKHVKLLNDRVLVELDKEEEKTSGGIIIPEAGRDTPDTGTVVAVGPGKVLDNGTKVPVTVEVGNKVMITKGKGTDVEIENSELLVVEEEDIIAVLED